jgi:hypothetical protein
LPWSRSLAGILFAQLRDGTVYQSCHGQVANAIVAVPA